MKVKAKKDPRLLTPFQTVQLDAVHQARVLKWVEDLESGRYTQIQDQLRDRIEEAKAKKAGFGYCCLGVACLTFKRETHRGRWDRDENAFVIDEYEDSGAMPAPVAKWLFGDNDNWWLTLGTIENPRLWDPTTGISNSAASWNDNEHADFMKIAAMVRHTFGLPAAAMAQPKEE